MFIGVEGWLSEGRMMLFNVGQQDGWMEGGKRRGKRPIKALAGRRVGRPKERASLVSDEQLPARAGAVDNAPNHRLQVESARHTEQHHHQLSISALQVRGLPNRWVGGQIPH